MFREKIRLLLEPYEYRWYRVAGLDLPAQQNTAIDTPECAWRSDNLNRWLRVIT